MVTVPGSNLAAFIDFAIFQSNGLVSDLSSTVKSLFRPLPQKSLGFVDLCVSQLVMRGFLKRLYARVSQHFCLGHSGTLDNVFQPFLWSCTFIRFGIKACRDHRYVQPKVVINIYLINANTEARSQSIAFLVTDLVAAYKTTSPSCATRKS